MQVRNKINPHSTFQSITCATVSRFNEEEWAPLVSFWFFSTYLTIYITFYSTHYVSYIRHNNIDERGNPKHLMIIDAYSLLKYWDPSWHQNASKSYQYVYLSLCFRCKTAKREMFDWLIGESLRLSIYSLRDILLTQNLVNLKPDYQMMYLKRPKYDISSFTKPLPTWAVSTIGKNILYLS